jgi:2-oxoglutarate ferredoxin oxidoreductase subunit alpha
MSVAGVRTGKHFMHGDHACAEGAIAAGCTFFGGYPITPSTEIAEYLARRLPNTGGVFIQMEDELSSIAAVLGASAAGSGFSLMMENLGLAIMLEIPCVLINVMRAAPSTGLPTLPGQADVMQAKWGSHGDYQIVAYAPSSPQEMFDLTIRAFNVADRYRTPVVVLADEVVGHMVEKVVIPSAKQIDYWERKEPRQSPGEDFSPFAVEDDDLVPPMVHAGEGYRIHFTGLTHDERGYPDMRAEAHHALVTRLGQKIKHNAEDIIILEEEWLEDAKIVVVSFGCTARSAKRAVRKARNAGMPVGFLRLVSLWPFPEKRIREIAKNVDAFIVPEINLGQVSREIERLVSQGVVGVNHAGGKMMTPDEILQTVMEVAGRGNGHRRSR